MTRRRAGAALIAIAFAGGACSGSGAGHPKPAAQPKTPPTTSVVVLDAVPAGFSAATATVERDLGAGWSAFENLGWTFAGPSADAVISATRARRLRDVTVRGVRGTLYSVEPRSVAELFVDRPIRQFPVWVDHAFMFVASNEHAAMAYVVGGLDESVFLHSTDDPPAAGPGRTSVRIAVSGGELGSDRVVRGIRVTGQPGCSADCHLESWTRLLGRSYDDRARVEYRRAAASDDTISVVGFDGPCERRPVLASAFPGFPAPPKRTITVHGKSVAVYRVADPSSDPLITFAGAHHRSGAPARLYLCVALPGGRSADLWVSNPKTGDAALAQIAGAVRPATPGERTALLDAAATTDDLHGPQPQQGIFAPGFGGLAKTTTAAPLRAPDPLPIASPGTVVAQHKIDGTGGNGLTAYKVLYHSRDRNGRDVATTALVIVPAGRQRNRPVLVSGHGTGAFVDGCSLYDEPADLSAYQGAYEAYLKAGVVVVQPDYIGNGGTPGVHTYLDAAELAHAMLDGARAARGFGGTGPVVFTGYSEGASASLSAGGYAARYAPELDMRGVVGVSLTTLYAEAFKAAAGISIAGAYESDIAVGLLAAHPDLHAADVLTVHGLKTLDSIREYERSQVCPENIPELQPSDFKIDPASLPAWRAAMEANYPDLLKIPAPVLITHDDTEPLHPVGLAVFACEHLVAKGNDVRFWHYSGGNGAAGPAPDELDREAWILSRLRGEPVTDTVAWHAAPPRLGAPC